MESDFSKRYGVFCVFLIPIITFDSSVRFAKFLWAISVTALVAKNIFENERSNSTAKKEIFNYFRSRFGERHYIHVFDSV